MHEPRVIVAPIALRSTNQVTLCPPWYLYDVPRMYCPTHARYEPLVNGEETFRAVHAAIAAAQSCVDIVCWGFQPSMYLIRDGRAPMLGELLEAKAREGVKVRILGWEMPLNAAGVAGEANLPERRALGILDGVMQVSTPAQKDYDRQWFKANSLADSEVLKRQHCRQPLFVSRGFSWSERRAIVRDLEATGQLDQISWMNRMLLRWGATHHQKSVLVDYDRPEQAVGFVMGHNLLDEYWDTDAHSALNRYHDRPAPNRGPRGKTPRQDISCRISGPILKPLNDNFASAWLRETGEDLSAREAVAQMDLKRRPGLLQMAQIVRTQAQEQAYGIERLYLQAVRNACQFIYIENQYFRWPQLAEHIREYAQRQVRGGRDPGRYGAIHLFVVTNADEKTVGAGAVNTQRTLELLGRERDIHGVTRALELDKLRAQMGRPPGPQPSRDRIGQSALEQWREEWRDEVRKIDEKLDGPATEIPGLKVHICSLVAKDSPAGLPWKAVYVHSKLMIVDDVFTTHGSANINLRSMRVDSELNIAHEWGSVTKALRQRLWNLHTAGAGAQDDVGLAFKKWEKLMNDNKSLTGRRLEPCSPLVRFEFYSPSKSDLD